MLRNNAVGVMRLAIIAIFASVFLLNWSRAASAQGGPLFQQGGIPAVEALTPYGYIDLARRWPGLDLEVCWEAGAEAFPQEQQLVHRAISSSLEQVSRLRFLGWGRCQPQSTGIRITVADEGPRAEVGYQGGRPTRMWLNFAFQQWPCPARDHCIVAIAIHEFLHAVGILHEHLRSDAPIQCRQAYAHTTDFTGVTPQAVTAYDPDSIMNYCNNIYDTARPPQLSRLDIVALQVLYGRR
jgi:hypothetical protein